MSATTIHPSTSTGAHRGNPDGDASENIQALRAASAVMREELERREAMEIGLRNALHRRNELTADLGLRLVRTEEALADLAEHAWRLQRENERLSAENRALREQSVQPRSRHRRQP